MNPNLSASNIPRGFTFAATHCGLKKTRLDLGIFVSDVPAAAAAVFTTNQVVAAPVVASREHLRKSHGWARGLIVNSGNANCCTRVDGYPASIAMTQKLADELGGVDPTQILVCSTGVIGAPLKVDRILVAVPDLVRARNTQAATFKDFAHAIMTTDTRPKWAAEKLRIGGKQVRLLGCAKGSGMIEPHMATMLAFIATDAAIPPALLSRALKTAVGRTFNSITVDGDTSTNDTCAVFANGESGARKITSASSSDFAAFSAALESVCKSLALAIVEDGEGAQRVIEIEVRGAASDRFADQIARTIANSPLVKTAFAGADPNWGRILAAAGRSGAKFNFELVDISVAGIEVCRGGREYPFNEITAHEKMLEKFVPIVVDLHAGSGVARVWTCDLTKEYIHINASYRT
ncbi:MAG TPA: bifunctional glutamate N-acetyltransferase/amino-acid acetyltransferase ArgJ [Candidatus Baltobacteraceae bacterium]|nr:bifunctional glutamate N-acetyltransferase/amino-acid acetyltransferase ArgJ [Candidatus Baltobacteraceae bacterium]